MSHPLLPKNLNKDNALFRQGKPDYSKLEADAFPTPLSTEGGAILENTDTGNRYRWTGSVWVQIINKGANKSYSEVNNFPLTAFGDLRTAELSPQFQLSFEYTVDNTELTTNTITNGGAVTQANAMAVVSSSTTTASTACLTSLRHARYKSGSGGMLRFSALFTTGIAATEQYMGVLDETGTTSAFNNGFAVGFDGVDFGVHRFSNDTKTSVIQSNFNIDKLDGTGASGFTIDHTKMNVWQIQYQYLGAGAIIFSVENPVTGNFVIAHIIQYANSAIEPSTYNPSFRFMAYVDNKATTSNLIVKTGSCAYFIEGKTEEVDLHQPQFGTSEQQKTTVTTETNICTIKNNTTYASKTNFIDILLEDITASIEASSANNLGTIKIIRDATLGGTPSYTDINTSDSVVSIDTAGTTVTGGKVLFVLPLAGKNDRELKNLLDYKIILKAGDTLTVSGTSANSATINASLLWKELF